MNTKESSLSATRLVNALFEALNGSQMSPEIIKHGKKHLTGFRETGDHAYTKKFDEWAKKNKFSPTYEFLQKTLLENLDTVLTPVLSPAELPEMRECLEKSKKTKDLSHLDKWLQ